MALNRVTLILLFAVPFLHPSNQEYYDMIVKRIECIELVKDYGSIQCSVNLKNRTTTFVQASYTPAHDIYPLIRIVVHYRFTMYRKFLVDITEDLCGYMRRTKPAPVLNIIWPSLVNASNFADGCPHRKGHTYYVKDYVSDGATLPPALPTGDYRIDATITNSVDNVRFVKVQVYLIIRRKLEVDVLWN